MIIKLLPILNKRKYLSFLINSHWAQISTEKKADKSISFTGVSLIVFFSVRDQNMQCAALRAFGSLSATDRSTFSKFIFLVTPSPREWFVLHSKLTHSVRCSFSDTWLLHVCVGRGTARFLWQNWKIALLSIIFCF